MPKRRAAARPRAAKPYDVVLKELVQLGPAAWAALVGGRRAGRVTVLSPDLASTVPVEADHVLRVAGPPPWLLQLEFQSTRDPTLLGRLHLYSVLLDRRYGLPVQSVIMLLRPEADARDLSGLLERQLPDGTAYLAFRYRMVRVWQQEAAWLLAGPLATLPLAPLTTDSPRDARTMLARIEARVAQEATDAEAERLRVGTALLLGLRFGQDVIDELLRGVGTMARALEASSIYQRILREGEARGLAEGEARGRTAAARRILLRLASQRFGPPDARTGAALERLRDPDRLEQAAERVVEAASWEALELLTPDDD